MENRSSREQEFCMTSRNKSVKCESFMTCCRLNLNGLQENKLMNMQQEWA